MQSSAVNEDENIRVTQTVHLQMGAHIVLVEGKTCRQSGEDILYRATCILLELSVTDDLSLDRGILQQMLRSSTRHDNFL